MWLSATGEQHFKFQAFVHEEIKNKLNSAPVFYNPVQNVDACFRKFSVKIDAFLILPIVLQRSVILRKEYRLIFFEKSAEKDIVFWGVGSEEKLEQLHGDKLHYFYYSQNIFSVIKSRRMRLKWHVARIGIHVGITERKRRIWITRGEREDNIKTDLKEIRWDGAEWIQLPRDDDF